MGEIKKPSNTVKKNPAYGRHQLSRPIRIVGPIQIWGGRVIYLSFFKWVGGSGGGWPMRGLKLIIWSQGQWEASKKTTRERGQSHNTQTRKQTFWLLDQLGPEGRVGENGKTFFFILQNLCKMLFFYRLYIFVTKKQLILSNNMISIKNSILSKFKIGFAWYKS